MADVQLRGMEEKDIERVRAWRNSPEIGRFMYTSEQISAEQQKQWFARVSRDPSCVYWIIEVDGRPVGVASVTNISKTLESCDWAFYLGDTEIRGGGIGSKVEFQVIDHVFSVLKLRKLRCEVLVTNPKVIQLHERFGFRREAYYRQHVRKDGEAIDVVGLGLLTHEWDALRPGHYQRIFETKEKN